MLIGDLKMDITNATLDMKLSLSSMPLSYSKNILFDNAYRMEVIYLTQTNTLTDDHNSHNPFYIRKCGITL